MKQCPNCGCKCKDITQVCPNCKANITNQSPMSQGYQYNQYGLRCLRCGSPYLTFQTVAESKGRNAGLVLLYIILFFIPIVGWIALFCLLVGGGTKTTTYAVCQSCGFRAPLKQ
ncbi:hypothetical protein RBG61_06685 [Paludicola sp. MB14-C6]|uniref:hypothetical protein n=1 Tax=Paludihabitans sp. MB14-C6 TaxID=3070656 RepID=UPI0027DCC968|nr:hypothetical protein [Paludicola sp. MB14-C6]WMJ24348.1 hypothetical protein RBG61_06685 [Paludicola sp. MB14-C6]